MNDLARFGATLVVWAATAAMVITVVVVLGASGAVLNTASLAVVAVALLIVLAVAARTTETIWESGRALPGQAQQAAATKDKRRVSGRVARLVDTLDDDELIELETLLMVRDEEAI